MTERELGFWLFGGFAESYRFCTTLKQFLARTEGRASLADVEIFLQNEGFTDATINLHLRWLNQDDWISIRLDEGEWSVRDLKL